MTGIGDTDPLRAKLDDLDFTGHAAPLVDALRAVLDVNQGHRDFLTAGGRFPERVEECHCLGCDSVRAISEALGSS